MLELMKILCVCAVIDVIVSVHVVIVTIISLLSFKYHELLYNIMMFHITHLN